jgi:hypothetical protein
MTAFPLLGRRDAAGNLPPKSYSASTWLHWLALRRGPDAVRAVWERSGEQAPFSFHPRAVDAALGAGAFFDELVAFSVAQAEWRTPASGFRRVPTAAYGDVEREGVLAAGGQAAVSLDHTTSALFDVPVPADAAGVELRVRAPAGTRSALALVGRTGGAEDGQVEVATLPLPAGGEGTVALPRPARFARLTAVVVNADASLASDRKDGTGQWTYARDGQRYELTAAALSDPPPPPPASGEAPAGPVVTQDAPSRDGPAGPAPQVEDVLAPVVRLLGFDARRRRVTFRIGEPTRVTATLLADRATARRLRLRSRVLARRSAMLRAGRRALTLPRVRRGLRVTLRIVAADAAGNVRMLTRRVVLRSGSSSSALDIRFLRN